MKAALFRRAGIKPLHLSLRTEKKGEYTRRKAAVATFIRRATPDLIELLRVGTITVEQVTDVVESGRDYSVLAPLATAAEVWPSVDASIQDYLVALRMKPSAIGTTADGTVRLAKLALEQFADRVVDGARVGTIALDRVTSAIVQGYQQSLIDGGVAPNSITVRMSRVASLWSWAAQRETRLARERRERPRDLYSPIVQGDLYRVHQPRQRLLTMAEADAVIRATPAELHWFIGCGLLAGLRLGETLHLRPGLDVDLAAGTITIQRQPTWRPKTRRAHRTVPMAPTLHAIARTHAARWASDSWMVPSTIDPTGPVSVAWARLQTKAIIERAGLVYGRDEATGATYHSLRHGFASHAIMAGVDLYTVAKLLGDRPEEIERTYGHLSPDHKRAAVAKLAGAFGALSEWADSTSDDTASDTENV